MLASLGFARADGGDAGTAKKDEDAAHDGTAMPRSVVRENSAGATLTARRPGAGASPPSNAHEDAGERLRRIERRAAAAQQRSLDKKISALTEEMAQVELLLNQSLETRQIETGTADKRKSDLKNSFAVIEAQHKANAAEMAIDMATAPKNGGEARAETTQLRVYVPPPQVEDGAVTRSPASNRKVRTVKARLTGEDDNDKYGSRDRSGNLFRMLSIYFGAETASRLPLPISIQRSSKRPFNAENAVVLIVIMSIVVGSIIYYLSSTHTISVQHGVSAGGQGWGPGS